MLIFILCAIFAAVCLASEPGKAVLGFIVLAGIVLLILGIGAGLVYFLCHAAS